MVEIEIISTAVGLFALVEIVCRLFFDEQLVQHETGSVLNKPKKKRNKRRLYID